MAAHKKEPQFRNIKEFKPANLSKVLTVAESKYEAKINLKRSGVVIDAKGTFHLTQPSRRHLSKYNLTASFSQTRGSQRSLTRQLT